MTLRRASLAGVVLALCVWAGPHLVGAQLPARLTDQEFWKLIADFSEADGFFDSDNLVSNEDSFQAVIPELRKTVKPGGVYLGVGPDQNFAYIIATMPRLSFITDVRRGNLHEHFMYKALVELSADRAEFLSRLFSRRRPAGLRAAATADELFDAYAGVPADKALYDENLRAMLDRLATGHGFKIDSADRDGIAYVYSNFFNAGPNLAFVSSRPGNRYPSYRQVQSATDGHGVNWGYLGSEERFQALKAQEQANLIVPIVGNFAGPHALRAIGAYVKTHGAVVSAFYTSNVEQYLFQDGLWGAFADNVRALPIDETSTFIRSCFNSCQSPVGSRSVTLLDSMAGLMRDASSRRVSTYRDVLIHSHQGS